MICGSAAGTVSARKGAYYAGPGNRFWPILAETGLTPRLFWPEEFPLLAQHSIGLTDMAKTVFGADTVIRPDHDDPERLRERIRHFAPGLLAFNGKRAASAFLGRPSQTVPYGEQTPLLDFPPIFVLPSTSGAAAGHWNSAYWHKLAERVRS